MTNFYRRNFIIFVALLILSMPLNTALAGKVTVSWDANSESDLSGYKVYYGTESRNYGTVIDVGNVTSHVIDNLQEGKTYYFAVTAYDFSQNESGFSVEVSASLSTSNNNPPELVAVAVRGETQIDLIFSEPLDKASAENASNYSISNGVQVLGAILDQDLTTVHLLTTQHERGKSYVVSVSNVKDLDQNSIPAGTSKSYSLPNPSGDTTPPQLVYVIIIDETQLDVIFNEPIEKTSAETVNNYTIDHGVQVLQARLNDNLSVVRLTTTAHQRGITYTLSVSNIRDLATNPNVIQPNSSLTYRLEGEDQTDTTPPTLVSVKVNGATQLDVNFSEPIEQTSAEQEQNYTISGGIQVLGAVLDDNFTTVHLITTAHKKGDTYTLTVRNIKDRAQPPNAMASNSSLNYTYRSDDDFPEDPGDTGSQRPATFALFQNYPNPFNPETEIRFFLEEGRDVSVKVYNMLGQVVKTLVKQKLGPGFHTVLWDGTNAEGREVPSGIYIYSLEVNQNIKKGDLLVNLALERRVMKMTLLR